MVTVAMPVFNAGRYLRPAVVSIIRQTFTDWELLVIDDGSSDGAVDDILDLDDSRIRIFRDGSNRGLAARLNEAIDLARGRYFARMDQDDISYPERLARQVETLEQRPEIDLCAVRCATINFDNELVGAMPYALMHDEICAAPWRGFFLVHPSWVGKIEWFRQHRYEVPGPYFCEDQELLLRCYRKSRFATVPEILFAYRVRNRIAWRKTFRTRKTILGIQLRNFFGMRQWHYVVLATVVFVARIMMDSMNMLAQNFGGSGYHRHAVVAIEVDERQRWREVSAHLALGVRFE